MDLERCMTVKCPFLTPKRAAAQAATFSGVGYLAHPVNAKAAKSGKRDLTQDLVWHKLQRTRGRLTGSCG
jgi:hypothetical protein